ncbi:hypothetical protein [Streptomyces sp. WZ-12]|uniref:hypothetical protein n=1 Tax=Streptomyces sp. WZ-12 TaxID=3030210 RepID=UPI0023814F14|nr:hypothetical protein [Streptomyces sp. WZ-12]
MAVSVTIDDVKADGKLSGTIKSDAADTPGTYTLKVFAKDSENADPIATGEFKLNAPKPQPQLDQIADVTAGVDGKATGSNFAQGSYTATAEIKS